MDFDNLAHHMALTGQCHEEDSKGLFNFCKLKYGFDLRRTVHNQICT